LNRRLAVDELIERLRSVKWEVLDDAERMPSDPAHECVFVDMRPADFRALLREAAAALEAARVDAERYRWLRDPCSGVERVIFYCRGDYGRGLMSSAMLDAAIDQARGKEGE
jgi:hypothetical protein